MTRRRHRIRHAGSVMLSAALLFGARGAHAQSEPANAAPAESTANPTQPSRVECLEAHQAAQEFKRTGKLLESAERLSICSAATCPGAIISDCGQWISDLEQMTPSLVFDVRRDGKQAPETKISVDGVPVDDTSKAFKVNPGRHVVRVELAPFEPREETVVLPEGQRMRLISMEFASPNATQPLEPSTPLAPLPQPEPERPTPVIVYPLLGVGVLGLTGFGTFSLLGRSKQKDLEKDCEPNCTDSDLESMKTMYLIGDISAGVGAAALIGAGIIYLTRPTEEASRTGVTFGVGPVGEELGSFGVSARRAF